jgi:hypothetical protein
VRDVADSVRLGAAGAGSWGCLTGCMFGDLEGVLLGEEPGWALRTKLRSPALDGVLVREISSSKGGLGGG